MCAALGTWPWRPFFYFGVYLACTIPRFLVDAVIQEEMCFCALANLPNMMDFRKFHGGKPSEFPFLIVTFVFWCIPSS